MKKLGLSIFIAILFVGTLLSSAGQVFALELKAPYASNAIAEERVGIGGSSLKIETVVYTVADYKERYAALPKIELSRWERFQVALGNWVDGVAKKNRVFDWSLNHPYMAGAIAGVVGGLAWYAGAAYVASTGGWAAVRVGVVRLVPVGFRSLTSGALIRGVVGGISNAISIIVSAKADGKPVPWKKVILSGGVNFLVNALVPVKMTGLLMVSSSIGTVIVNWFSGEKNWKVFLVDAVLSVLLVKPVGEIVETINWRVGRTPVRYLWQNFVGAYARREVYRNALGVVIDVTKDRIVKLVSRSKEKIEKIYNFSRNLW